MYRTFLFLVLVFLLICCEKSTPPRDYNYKNLLVIKNGIKLIQGKNYEIIWNVEGLNSDIFFSNIIFHFERNGNFQTKVIKLSRLDSIHFKGTISIPPKTSSVFIGLSTPYSSLSCPYSIRLPVYINEYVPEYGANSVLLLNSNKSEYLKFFYQERWLYPENYSIFVSKWLFELDNKIFSKDSIQRDLMELNELSYSPDILIVKLIGNSILMNYSHHKEIIKDLSQNLKFSSCLNNWETADILFKMLKENIYKDSVNIKNLIDSIIKYNPYSHFVNSLISGGSISDKRIVNPTTAIKVLNKLNKSNLNYFFLLKKAFILASNYHFDSTKTLNEIVEIIHKSFINYFKDDEYYYKIQDFYHTFLKASSYLPYIYKQLAFATNRYSDISEYLKDFINIPYTNLVSKGIFYLSLGEIYEKMNLKDSALKYIFYSYSTIPNSPFLKEKLSRLIKDGKKSIFYQKLALLKQKYGFPMSKIGPDFPLFEYLDGRKEDITKWNGPKILVFFSVNCNSCEILFATLAKFKDLLETKKARLLILSSDEFSKLQNLNIYKFWNARIVANSRQFKNYFGMDDNVPQIIFINSDNFIVNWFNGLPDYQFNWSEILINLN